MLLGGCSCTSPVFDPRLTLRFHGLTFATRCSGLAVLGVVAGGVLHQLGNQTDVRRHPVAWAFALGAVCALFLLTLLVHELIRQRQWGQPARRHWPVELMLIGSASDSPEAPPTPRTDLIGLLTGLATLIACTGFAWSGARLLHQLPGPGGNAGQTLANALLTVAIINAMPAFPLDGGHIFRAWLWYLTGDLVLATRIAALYASMLAIAVVIVGAALIFGSANEPYWGFGLGVAGFQLHGAARRSLRRARWSIAGATLSLREAVPYPARFPLDGTVASAVDLLLAGPPESFLLITDDETPVGILRLVDLRGTHRARWDRMPVGEVMTPFTALPRLPAELTVPEAMAQLAGRATAAIVQDGDRVLGVVTSHDLVTAVTERANRAGAAR